MIVVPLLLAAAATATRTPAANAPVASTPAASTPAANAVAYAPPAAWVLSPPARSAAPTPAEAPVRVAYIDNQVRVSPTGEEQAYTAYRLKILKPEALPVGNVTLAWSPGAGRATVHFLRIIRDGAPIDVLAATKFQVIQREGGLEQSMLDGQLTATLQVPGLQVGDELEFGVTITRREAALGGHVAGYGQFSPMGAPGAFRYRLLWPADRALEWQATKDLPPATPETAPSGEKLLVYELRDPAGSVPTEGAPLRYNLRRLIEYSDYDSWAAVSRQLWPLFDAAGRLGPASPLKAEAARIAAASTDPVARVQAALRLVQDRVRYVYVGLNDGNYRPALADETWTRRFGDCKAKTVLLIALLRELGIAAEPVLVNSKGGDGTSERLPSPSAFDHVLVRAQVAGQPYWLDGTRLGDRYLDILPPPAFRWALPLSTAGSGLQPVKATDQPLPQFTGVVDVDASAGLDKPATVTARHITRGDDAFVLRTRLAALSAEDADRAVKGYWRGEMDWVDPDKVGWTYDERRGAIVLTLAGTGKPAWTGDAKAGRSFTIPGAGFYAPDQMKRPKDQDQTASWAVEFPRYRCWATTIRLPAPDARMNWTYYAVPVDQRLGGAAYWRKAGFDGHVVRTVMSRRSYLPELTAVDASLLNGQIAGFNNNMSSVFETADRGAAKRAAAMPLPFGDDADWLAHPDACTAPPAKPSS